MRGLVVPSLLTWTLESTLWQHVTKSFMADLYAIVTGLMLAPYIRLDVLRITKRSSLNGAGIGACLRVFTICFVFRTPVNVLKTSSLVSAGSLAYVSDL